VVLKRLAAVAFAVLIVAGAFWVRDLLDEGGDGSGPGNGASTTTTAVQRRTVVCSPELAAACDALAAGGLATTVVEPAGTTAARLERTTAAADVPDAWLTLDPWPAMVDDVRGRAQLDPLFSDPARLASSALAVVGSANRLDVLDAHCGNQATWRCIGEVAGRPWADLGGQPAWQTVKPGHASPVDSASGLLVFGNAVVSYFGRTDVSAADLADDGFRSWVRQLERAVPNFGGPQGTPYEQWNLPVPSFDLVGTTGAEITATPPRPDKQARVFYPSPMGRADAVIVTSGGRAPDEAMTAAARSALTASGWDAPADGAAEGLPSVGTLEALQQVWEEVA
jgi:hypothetical protein